MSTTPSPVRTDPRDVRAAELADGAGPLPARCRHAARPASVSVVMPVYNERDNLAPAVHEVLAVLDRLERPAELIVVDDGSDDGTSEALDELLAVPRRDGGAALRALHLRRNFGQTAALSAGIDRSVGDAVVLIDGDQQNDPADIPLLLRGLEDGYDVVSGWRARRQDPLLSRRLPSRCANALISRVTGVALHDYGCTLKAYDGALLRSLRLYGEQHRFIPALASMHGARVLEVAVNHRPRTRGSSKYGISRLPRVLADLLTVTLLLRYRSRPIQLFAKGALCCLVGAGALAATRAVLAVGRGRPGAGASRRAFRLAPRPPAARHGSAGSASLVLLAGGVQLLATGLVAELVTRAWHEGGPRATYVVAGAAGFSAPAVDAGPHEERAAAPGRWPAAPAPGLRWLPGGGPRAGSGPVEGEEPADAAGRR